MKLKPLGDVAEVIAGQSPEGVYYNSTGEGIPFYQGKKEFGDKFLGNPTTWTSKITKLAQSGDILMSVRAPVGPINFATQEICIGRGLAAIRPSESIDREYLFYFLLHKQPDISGNTGAVFDSINRNQIASIEVPLPSPAQQTKIVKKLDAAFAEIDLLEKNLDLSDKKAKQLLHSLLNSAFALSVFGPQPGISAEHQKVAIKLVQLGDVCTVINGGTPDTKIQEYWDGEHAWITPAEMGNLISPYLANSRRKLTDQGLRNSSAHLLPQHSVIMSSRAPIGHLVINQIPMASNQGCKGLIPNDDLDYRYLYYFLFANKEYLNALGSGTTFAEISGSKLKTVEIPLPSLEKQYEIIDKLDVALECIDKIRNQIAIKKDFAVMLRQSLLSDAFSSTDEMVSA